MVAIFNYWCNDLLCIKPRLTFQQDLENNILWLTIINMEGCEIFSSFSLFPQILLVKLKKEQLYASFGGWQRTLGKWQKFMGIWTKNFFLSGVSWLIYDFFKNFLVLMFCAVCRGISIIGLNSWIILMHILKSMWGQERIFSWMEDTMKVILFQRIPSYRFSE